MGSDLVYSFGPSLTAPFGRRLSYSTLAASHAYVLSAAPGLSLLDGVTLAAFAYALFGAFLVACSAGTYWRGLISRLSRPTAYALFSGVTCPRGLLAYAYWRSPHFIPFLQLFPATYVHLTITQ